MSEHTPNEDQIHDATCLDGERWAFASNHRETWLVLATPQGMRASRMMRNGDDAVAHRVGEHVVFIGAGGRELFYVRSDAANRTDNALAETWIAAQVSARHGREGIDR